MKRILCALLLLALSPLASASTYSYVGSWYVDDGPWWSDTDAGGNYTTPVLSGQEAAALLFGGNPEDYVISTVSNLVADINFSAWMDGWADQITYGDSGNPAPQGLHVDVDGDGLYATPFGYQNAYSAYVDDHGLHLENFAFRVSSVPLPAAVWLFGSVLLGLIGFSRRKMAMTAS